MLQQTQVDRVVPHYERFLAAFPTPAACAAAGPAAVVRLWSGLGYNRRALNLHRAAAVMVADHGGAVPARRRGPAGPAGRRSLHGARRPLLRLRGRRGRRRHQRGTGPGPCRGRRAAGAPRRHGPGGPARAGRGSPGSSTRPCSTSGPRCARRPVRAARAARCAASAPGGAGRRRAPAADPGGPARRRDPRAPSPGRTARGGATARRLARGAPCAERPGGGLRVARGPGAGRAGGGGRGGRGVRPVVGRGRIPSSGCR